RQRLQAKWMLVRVEKTRQQGIQSVGSDLIRAKALADIGKLVQRCAKYLAGLADQRRSIHHAAGVGEGSGDTDADRSRAAEQWIVVRAWGGVPLHEHFALEGVVLDRVGAGVKQIGIAAEDLSIAEQNHSAALADAPVEQGDVD